MILVKRLLVAFAIVFICIIAIVGLYRYTSFSMYSGGFNRKIIFSNPRLLQTVDLKVSQNYFSGLSVNHLYIANYSRTAMLQEYDIFSSQVMNFYVGKPDTGRIAWKMIHSQVDSPNVYLMEGWTPSILNANLSEKFTHRVNLHPPNFTSSLALTPGSFLLRSFEKSLNQYILSKVIIDKADSSKFVLEKEGEGVFSLDGFLLKGVNGGRIVYVYFYQNKFHCLDSNLKILYTAHTIDTIRHAHLKLSEIESEHKITMSAPPFIVNNAACLNSHYLLINSLVCADNEDRDRFESSSVIDVYSLSSGHYLSSFYLNNLNGKRLTDLRLCGDTLFALYDRYIGVYTIHNQLPVNRD